MSLFDLTRADARCVLGSRNVANVGVVAGLVGWGLGRCSDDLYGVVAAMICKKGAAGEAVAVVLT
jgi:hypothetical protein